MCLKGFTDSNTGPMLVCLVRIRVTVRTESGKFGSVKELVMWLSTSMCRSVVGAKIFYRGQVNNIANRCSVESAKLGRDRRAKGTHRHTGCPKNENPLVWLTTLREWLQKRSIRSMPIRSIEIVGKRAESEGLSCKLGCNLETYVDLVQHVALLDVVSDTFLSHLGQKDQVLHTLNGEVGCCLESLEREKPNRCPESVLARLRACQSGSVLFSNTNHYETCKRSSRG
jgi:hypothetical protein